MERTSRCPPLPGSVADDVSKRQAASHRHSSGMILGSHDPVCTEWAMGYGPLAGPWAMHETGLFSNQVHLLSSHPEDWASVLLHGLRKAGPQVVG